jgi:hypothetical protein
VVLGFFSIAATSSLEDSYASSFYASSGISNAGPLRKSALAEKAKLASTLSDLKIKIKRPTREVGTIWNQQHNGESEISKENDMEQMKMITSQKTASAAAASSSSQKITTSTTPLETIISSRIDKENKEEEVDEEEENVMEEKKMKTDPSKSTRSENRPLMVSSPPPPPPLLVIGIPSIRRNGDPDYVVRTVRYLKDQLRSPHSTKTHETGSDLLSSPYPLRVRILVMNNQRSSPTSPSSSPSQHLAFEQLLSSECNGNGGDTSSCELITAGPHTVYAKKNGLLALARTGAPISENLEELSANINIPSGRVRQQARDVMSLLDLAHELYGHDDTHYNDNIDDHKNKDTIKDGLLSSFDDKDADDKDVNGKGRQTKKPLRMFAYLFMEDDFRLCPQGFESIALALHRARASNMDNWNAIRISYGLNGAIIRGVDVPKLSKYYLKRYALRPPDHLLVEWFAGETVESAATKAKRPHLSYKFNLLEHFGHTSSLRIATSAYFPYCYQLLDEKVVFEVEAFKVAECNHDVLWPCLQPSDSRFLDVSNHSRMDFEKLVKEGTELTLQKWTL